VSLRLPSLCSIESGHPFIPTCLLGRAPRAAAVKDAAAMRRHRRSRRKASLTERARCYPSPWRHNTTGCRAGYRPALFRLIHWCEVLFLQQRVCLSAASTFEVQNPGFPRGCARLAWPSADPGADRRWKGVWCARLIRSPRRRGRGSATAIDGTRPRKSGSHRTPRWREMDSNLRFPTVNGRGLSAEQAGFELLVPYRAARSRKGCDVSWVLTAARVWRNVRPLGRVLFCELGPAGTDQAIGIFGGHLDDAILSDGDASA
jgi:hypothetical protein